MDNVLNFLVDLIQFNIVSKITILIALASVIGIFLGSIKYKGVGLGIGGVLFGGIAMGWLAVDAGLLVPDFTDPKFNEAKAILHYIQEFGLILFVYTIGVQVGPGFFSSLKGSGYKLILCAIVIVLLGSSIALSFNLLGLLDLDVALGVYSGAVTNTPALGAGSSMLADIANNFVEQGKAIPEGFNPSKVSSAYAIAYPFGICGILLTMLIIRFAFKVNIEQHGELYEVQKKSNRKDLNTLNVCVKNSAYFDKKLADLDIFKSGDVICSRIKRDDTLMVPKGDTVVKAGDILHIVGNDNQLNDIAKKLGELVQDSLTTKGTDLVVKKVVVTNEKILGKSLDSLSIKSNYDVVVSRLVRTGMEFIPHSGTTLQFGDHLNLVGRKESVSAVANIVGDSAVALQKVHMLPVFIGLVLGMLLGALSIPVPGLPAALKLGLAGGPLVVAILLSRFGHIITMNKIHWFMPATGNSALREIGIVLFLAIVGFNAGLNGFMDTLINKGGYVWMMFGAAVTLIPILIVGTFAFKVLRLNYLSVCGMLAGSMTDPPALAYANGMYKNSEASALGYATVYPFTMFLRILTPQIMILISLAVM